jgi:CRISPR/Cas system-associated endonuclease Cas1
LLNFTFAIAESECRLAAVACGLDPGLGFLHSDTANRDSLALDIIESPSDQQSRLGFWIG